MLHLARGLEIVFEIRQQRRRIDRGLCNALDVVRVHRGIGRKIACGLEAHRSGVIVGASVMRERSFDQRFPLRLGRARRATGCTKLLHTRQLYPGFVIAAIDGKERKQPPPRLVEAALPLRDLGEGLEGDHVLVVELEHPRKRQLGLGVVPQVELAAAEDDACRDVVGMAAEPLAQDLEGARDIPHFPIGFGEGGKGEPLGVLAPPAFELCDLAAGHPDPGVTVLEGGGNGAVSRCGACAKVSVRRSGCQHSSERLRFTFPVAPLKLMALFAPVGASLRTALECRPDL